MKDRIKKFIDYKGISAGELAEITGVQRSNISHIFNGRNKPGAQFIENFLNAFPEVNARWLLTGNGSMLHENSGDNLSGSRPAGEVKSEPDIQYGIKHANDDKEKKEVQKLILLNSDGTFVVYTAENTNVK
jgi:transcriptional regulator with XRE-family HTH domain